MLTAAIRVKITLFTIANSCQNAKHIGHCNSQLIIDISLNNTACLNLQPIKAEATFFYSLFDSCSFLLLSSGQMADPLGAAFIFSPDQMGAAGPSFGAPFFFLRVDTFFLYCLYFFQNIFLLLGGSPALNLGSYIERAKT